MSRWEKILININNGHRNRKKLQNFKAMGSKEPDNQLNMTKGEWGSENDLSCLARGTGKTDMPFTKEFRGRT